MATLQISKDLYETRPDAVAVVREYFDSMTELVPERADTLRFAVQKEGLPTDDTVVDCLMGWKDGEIYVIQCK